MKITYAILALTLMSGVGAVTHADEAKASCSAKADSNLTGKTDEQAAADETGRVFTRTASAAPLESPTGATRDGDAG